MDIESWWTIPTDAINETTFPFTLSTLNSFNPFNLFNPFNPMKRLALLLPLLALAAGCHNLSDGRATEDDPFLAQARAILAECRPGVEPPPPGSASRTTAIEFRCGDSSLWDGVPIEGRALEHVGIASFGKPADPADIALVRPYLAHTNAAVRNAAVRILEDWLADLAVPFPVDDPALPADLEAAAEARAAEPPPPLPAYDGGDASTFLRLVAVERRVQGPLPERPFAVLTNDIGRLDCWERLFLLDGDDSALRRVQEMLGVRYPTSPFSAASSPRKPQPPTSSRPFCSSATPPDTRRLRRENPTQRARRAQSPDLARSPRSYFPNRSAWVPVRTRVRTSTSLRTR